MANGQELASAYVSVSIDTSALDAGFKRVEASSRQAVGSLERVATAGKSLGSFNASGLLQLSYVLDDLQYGFRAIVNNIPGVVTGLGTAAGLGAATSASIAGAAGIAAVALSQLITHFDVLTGKFENSKTAEEAERMQRLADQTERANRAARQIAEAPTALQEEATQGVMALLKEAPGAMVEEAIKASLAAEGGGLAQPALENMKRLEARLRMGDMDEVMLGTLRDLEKQQRDNQFKMSQELLGSLPTDPAARARVAAMAEKQPGLFPPNFAAQLREFSPENMAKQAAEGDKALEEAEAMGDRARKATERRRKHDLMTEKIAADMGKDIERENKNIQRRKIDDLEEHRHQLLRIKKEMAEEFKSGPMAQIFGGTHEFVNAMQTNALNSIPKAQLEEAKKLNGKIDKLTEEIRRQQAIARAM